MPDYSKAKIYKIKPKGEHPPEDEYIGSTNKLYLSSRMAEHRHTFLSEISKITCSSYALFNIYGLDQCVIELLEEYPCKTRKELLDREGYWIKNSPCINKNKAGVSIDESKKDWYKKYGKEYNRDYYMKNQEVLRKKALERFNKKKYVV
jgi:hypothetical protein